MNMMDKLNEINLDLKDIDEKKLEKEKKAEEMARMIIDNSVFNCNEIGNIIEDLYMIFNNKEVRYLDFTSVASSSKSYSCLSGVIISLENLEKINIESILENHETLNRLNICARFFADKDCNIQFYDYNGSKKILRFTGDDLDKDFYFLKDFIDYVIDYRIEHFEELKGKISGELLKSLEKEYLKFKKDEILESFDRIEQEGIDKLKQDTTQKRKRLLDICAN